MHIKGVVLIVFAGAVNAAPSYWRGGTLWPSTPVKNSITGKPCNQQGFGHAPTPEGCPTPQGAVGGYWGYGHSTPIGHVPLGGISDKPKRKFVSLGTVQQCRLRGAECVQCCIDHDFEVSMNICEVSEHLKKPANIICT